jgi:hypothetical protein
MNEQQKLKNKIKPMFECQRSEIFTGMIDKGAADCKRFYTKNTPFY